MCRRVVGHVYAVFTFGSEDWSWTVLTLDNIKVWETKTTKRQFRFRRTCNMARKIWIQSSLFMHEVITAMGWACDERPTAVIDTKKKSRDGERDGGIPCKWK